MKAIIEQITIDDFNSGNLVPVENNIPSTLETIAPSEPTSTDNFGPVTMGLTGTTPKSQTASSQDMSSTIADDDSSDQGDGNVKAKEYSSPTEREKELFKKFHASDFDPNSSMDRKKLEQLRQAAQQVGDSDENKLRATTYSIQSKDPITSSRVASTSRSAPKPRTPIQQATAPASPQGGPTYYVRTGFNQYRPAVNADITSNQQLFMRNPNPVARAVYPYVKVDSRSVRRASPAR